MMKDREKQLQNVENEHKMDTVQDRFPNDDLNLQEKDKVSFLVAHSVMHCSTAGVPSHPLHGQISKTKASLIMLKLVLNTEVC